VCVSTEDYSAALAYELISQLSATSSNFGVVHSMVFSPFENNTNPVLLSLNQVAVEIQAREVPKSWLQPPVLEVIV